MLKFTKEMFNGTSNWQQAYFDGRAWSTNGIEGLKTSGINPYHVALSLDERLKNNRRVVYAIYEMYNQDPTFCFFEDDYIEGFKKFTEIKKKNYDDDDSTKLYVSYLNANSSNPFEVWINGERYMNGNHSRLLHWNMNKFGSGWYF